MGILKICENQNCKKEFEAKRKDKKYCSQKCRANTNSIKYYGTHKHIPEFKEKLKTTFNKWRLEHKEHFNDLVRETNRLLRAKRYKERKELKTCVRCGKEIKLFSFDNTPHSMCIKCRIAELKKNNEDITKSRLVRKIQKNDIDKQLYLDNVMPDD
jgi:hypothetical protein